MDRSFQGLLISLAIHALLVWLIVHSKTPPLLSQFDAAEITLVEREMRPEERRKIFVTETEKEDEKKTPEERLKEEADHLSLLTKRVKKQMRARESGPTRNTSLRHLSPRLDTKPPEEHPQGVAGMAQSRRERGVGLPTPGSALREVVIGPSTISEHIPGVEEGAFTALNTDQFTYYAFFHRINEQIRNRWVNQVRGYMERLSHADLEALSRLDRQTVVEVVLGADGRYFTSYVHTSSGDEALDQAAIRAFRTAAPFLNPPRGLVEDDGLIHLHYGFMVRFRPPTFGPGG
ncbi:MAG: TonB family protein [Bdellovibrionales bacterium]